MPKRSAGSAAAGRAERDENAGSEETEPQIESYGSEEDEDNGEWSPIY